MDLAVGFLRFMTPRSVKEPGFSDLQPGIRNTSGGKGTRMTRLVMMKKCTHKIVWRGKKRKDKQNHWAHYNSTHQPFLSLGAVVVVLRRSMLLRGDDGIFSASCGSLRPASRGRGRWVSGRCRGQGSAQWTKTLTYCLEEPEDVVGGLGAGFGKDGADRVCICFCFLCRHSARSVEV